MKNFFNRVRLGIGVCPSQKQKECSQVAAIRYGVGQIPGQDGVCQKEDKDLLETNCVYVGFSTNHHVVVAK